MLVQVFITKLVVSNLTKIGSSKNSPTSKSVQYVPGEELHFPRVNYINI